MEPAQEDPKRRAIYSMNTLVAVVRIYLVLGQEKPCEVFLEFGGYRQSDILLRKSKTWRYKLQRFHLTILVWLRDRD
uniref:Uncharacterized protein n=1 Tax=Oryza rufipogon TaxID=4529 RepID=A0A0E0Q057_ORYRU